jgi:type IV pilus assembly protein PilF
MRTVPFLLAMVLLVTACTATAPLRTSTPESKKAAQTHLELGVAYLRRSQFAVARDKLLRVVDLAPDLVAGHSALALAYQGLGEHAKAEEQYRIALELAPGDGVVKNNFGTFLCQLGRADEAERMFVDAANSPGYNTPEAAYVNAALCLMRKGRMKPVEGYLRSALEKNARFPVALKAMARLQYEQRHYRSAQAFLQRLFSVSEPQADTLLLAVRVERQLGNRATANEYSQQLRARFPDSTEVLLLRDSEQR